MLYVARSAKCDRKARIVPDAPEEGRRMFHRVRRNGPHIPVGSRPRPAKMGCIVDRAGVHGGMASVSQRRVDDLFRPDAATSLLAIYRCAASEYARDANRCDLAGTIPASHCDSGRSTRMGHRARSNAGDATHECSRADSPDSCMAEHLISLGTVTSRWTNPRCRPRPSHWYHAERTILHCEPPIDMDDRAESCDAGRRRFRYSSTARPTVTARRILDTAAWSAGCG